MDWGTMSFSPEAMTLLADLRRYGFELQAHGDRIRYRPEPTPAMLAAMRIHKIELLAMLLVQQAEAHGDDLAEAMTEAWQERVAIASEKSDTVTPDQMQDALVQVRAMLERAT